MFFLSVKNQSLSVERYPKVTKQFPDTHYRSSFYITFDTMTAKIISTIGILFFTLFMGRCSKTCIKCVECRVCSPCDTKEEVEKEIIIKQLKDEIHDIQISSDRQRRNDLWAKHTKR